MEKQIKIINVSNGNSKYVGNFTIEEEKIILENIIGLSVNYFSGNSTIGNERFDLNNKNATKNIDIFKMIELHEQIEEDMNFHANRYNTIIIDAPYNSKFADKYSKISNTDRKQQFIIFADAKKTTKLFNYITEFQKPERIIIKSWNYYIPKGYFLKKGYLCYAGGYRKPTILLILDKIC